MDDLLSSESGGLRQPDAGEQVLGGAGNSPEGRPPGSHPSAPEVVARLVMEDGQGIGVGRVIGPRPLAVKGQRQGPDVSCGAHHPQPRGVAAVRVEPTGAKEQWVMETQVLKSQIPHHPPPKAPRPQYLGAVHLTVSDGGPRTPTISVTVAIGPVVIGGATRTSWKCQGEKRGLRREEVAAGF